ncbi:hypothetical protein [Bradyrhizobium sp. CW11]|uniref:hypothetical protein n=1 Tax=Bradyrhizobium sp. CW11 TaxID=2782684 RepID=UPI001FF77062|nr:hypothetical protein [Bradyrhizobium sp. CW11]MCK1348641.1 hypothetical protein [Bradyrhizobium sp. CW11]
MLSRSSSGSGAISKQAHVARARGKRAEEYQELLRSRFARSRYGSALRVDLANYERWLPKHLREAFKHYEEGVRLRVIENEASRPGAFVGRSTVGRSHLNWIARVRKMKPIDRRWTGGSMEAVSKADGRQPNGDKSSRFQQFRYIFDGTVETVHF